MEFVSLNSVIESHFLDAPFLLAGVVFLSIVTAGYNTRDDTCLKEASKYPSCCFGYFTLRISPGAEKGRPASCAPGIDSCLDSFVTGRLVAL